jgi:hypothetical protein
MRLREKEMEKEPERRKFARKRKPGSFPLSPLRRGNRSTHND